MTYSDPNSPYEPPPRDDNTGMWMALAVIVLIILGGLVYVVTNRPEQSAANAPSAPVTTGQGSRMAPPPPAPQK